MSAARATAAAWVALYGGLVALPLAVAVAVDPFETPRPHVVEFAVATGVLALSVGVLQLALVSRVQSTSRRFGSDRLIALHRAAGAIVLLFAIAHAGLLGDRLWLALNPFAGSLPIRWGAVAVWTLVVVVGSSVFRRRLRLSYERWRVLHATGAGLFVATATAHALSIGGYASVPLMRWTLVVYAGLAAWLVVYRWIVRPGRLAGRPWEVLANDAAGGSTRLVRVWPVGHAGFRFEAGQFAWLVTGRSAFSLEQHPLSIASSSARRPGDPIEFAIKGLGDWSGTVVPALARGDRVWVDGPYGALTVRGATSSDDAPRLVLIAGGIGIAPMRAILQTMAARQDRRPIALIYAAAHSGRVAFGAEVDAIRHTLRLDVVYVFEQPDAAWRGERGRVTADLLRRHLGDDVVRCEYLLCGPPGMIDAVGRELARLGVPAGRVRTERFHLV